MLDGRIVVDTVAIRVGLVEERADGVLDVVGEAVEVRIGRGAGAENDGGRQIDATPRLRRRAVTVADQASIGIE